MTHAYSKDPVQLAADLAKMTDDELFTALRDLEQVSDKIADNRDADVFAQIDLATSEIESRFPGQAMSPYKDWQRRQIV